MEPNSPTIRALDHQRLCCSIGKARDALLRGFPEVESVIGKAGRADTPTDPAPLDMVETFVNFRPKHLWPKRVLRYTDAAIQTEAVFDRLVADGFAVAPSSTKDRQNLVNDVTQKAIERFDEVMRELALRRYSELEIELQAELTQFAVETTLEMLDNSQLRWSDAIAQDAFIPVGSFNRSLADGLGDLASDVP